MRPAARRRARGSERVIVVGAGLVGCLLSIYLKRRGFRVTVYERNRDPRQFADTTRPSLSLSLCERGVHSLERAGVMDRIWLLLAPVSGRVVHGVDGSVSYQPYSAFGKKIHCVSRRNLVHVLVNAAEERGVDIRFNQRCTDIDPASGEIAVEGSQRERTHDRAAAIFAADGCRSALRQRLDRHGWIQQTLTPSGDGYKAFRLSPQLLVATGLRIDALHGWPRPGLVAGGFPERDGSLLGTLHMPLSGELSFETKADRAALAALLEEACPELAPAVSACADQLAAQRPNSLMMAACSPWSAGRVLLLGDAAHAMLPYYGQGANAGFEDCAVLDDLIGRHSGNWNRTFRDFEALRKPDVDAMTELSLEHLTVLRDRVTQPDFQARWRLEHRLHRRLRDSFTPLYSMIAFSSLPYAEARRRDHVQQTVIRELLSDPDIARQLAEPVWKEPLCQYLRSRFAAAGSDPSSQWPAALATSFAPGPSASWTRGGCSTDAVSRVAAGGEP